MINVGITGGIGTGKTTVCNAFMQLGIPIFNADIQAKVLMESDSQIREELIKLLGKNIYSGMEINKQSLASVIFSDPELRKQVNSIVHPRVAKHYIKWSDLHHEHLYVIHESALLFESNAYKLMDVTVTITAPEELRIQRVLERPGMNREKILSIINSQLPEEYKIQHSDFVINNDNTDFLIPQILKLHKYLSDKSVVKYEK